MEDFVQIADLTSAGGLITIIILTTEAIKWLIGLTSLEIRNGMIYRAMVVTVALYFVFVFNPQFRGGIQEVSLGIVNSIIIAFLSMASYDSIIQPVEDSFTQEEDNEADL